MDYIKIFLAVTLIFAALSFAFYCYIKNQKENKDK